MPTGATTDIATEAALDDALAQLAEHSHSPTDGVWLEDLTRRVAPILRDWNVSDCWLWPEWPHREEVMPEGTPSVDVGIDLVARRRDDGAWIAIQVKSRRLNSQSEGAPVNSDEINKFLAAAANPEIWAERWLVVNGAVPLGGYSEGKASMSGAALKVVNVAQAIRSQKSAQSAEADSCPHCEADGGSYFSNDAPPPRRAHACNGRRSGRRWNACARTSRPMRTTSREARRVVASCCLAALARHV